MEKFFIPVDKTNFVRWLLQVSVNNNRTIVVEYSISETYKYLIENATETALPSTVRHEYYSGCKLTAFINPMLTDNFINQLIHKSHVLSVHSKTQMIFLIADDFHEECFSCTTDFYNNYYDILDDRNLIDTGW